MGQVDYLVIGHITDDYTPDGMTIGGSVAYAGRTAQALGCRTAVVTSSQVRDDLATVLPSIAVQHVPAPHTTAFTNRYEGIHREQWLHAVAAPLRAEHVPEAWRRSAIVHLAPVAAEVDVEMMALFSNSLIGLTPQGWMRQWDEGGRVRGTRWEQAETAFPLAAAVILSDEDLPDESYLEVCRQYARLLVMTQGPAGCTVFFGDDARSFEAPAAPVRDLTGAGDVFAAAFLVRLYQTRGNPWEAAVFANEVAAASVTQVGLAAKIAHIEAMLQP
ncbi:MAG: PfkB family carbohydrate kinase [Anaerolineae bacterium]|nr:PfkB family carbohydrate kinase [Anaerolineae bacterium]